MAISKSKVAITTFFFTFFNFMTDLLIKLTGSVIIPYCKYKVAIVR
jgi:hypothetical protein